ncbi:hypothetical protein L917_04574 [Phytophthora nicotianae]|uniref:Uncharacterized protein n=1 Tax=Phytophthora nicotianae TaxID=4792 RepID=W2LLK0_PHYNI|nr:hypothetical protein L917_04574 [Phytophthora nicotianae]
MVAELPSTSAADIEARGTAIRSWHPALRWRQDAPTENKCALPSSSDARQPSPNRFKSMASVWRMIQWPSGCSIPDSFCPRKRTKIRLSRTEFLRASAYRSNNYLKFVRRLVF